jgi:S-phase kinase-associated protein 1
MADLINGETKVLHLVSQEGESFDVPVGVGRMSELVKMMIDDDQDDEESQEIPLPNVKSVILAKVIEYCQHYKTEPMTEIEKVYLSIHTNVTIKSSLMLELKFYLYI